MRVNKVQLASLLLLSALFTVPSFAFPNNPTSCYQATLSDGSNEYGYAQLIVIDNKAKLEVKIDGFLGSGEFEVAIFKDYYSDFIAGNIKLTDGEDKKTFDIPYLDPDFQVIIRTTPELRSGEWIECEVPVNSDTVKISPSTLNLRSIGNWVTVTVRISTDPMPTDFTLRVGDGDPIEPVSVKVTGDHITLKFNRAEFQSICFSGENMVTLSFKIGEEYYEFANTIKVIANGSNGVAVKTLEKIQNKSNNGNAKGRNKDN